MVEVKRYILTALLALTCLAAAAQHRTLIHGTRWEGDLSAEQMDELKRAHASEGELPPLVAGYRNLHTGMGALAAEYGRVTTEAAADSIRARFDSAAREASDLDGRIARTWEMIFDGKSYIYNYLMDKNNRNDMLAMWDEGIEQLRARQAQWRGVYASDASVDYLLQKRLLADYEIALARETGNTSAVDSLRRVLTELPRLEALAGFEPIVLAEREFIDTLSTKPVYRLELSGAGELPPGAREAIERGLSHPAGSAGSMGSAGAKTTVGSKSGGRTNADIVRVAGGWVVTPLDGATAVGLRRELGALESWEFTIKISKISE